MIDEPLSRMMLAAAMQPEPEERRRPGHAGLRRLVCAVILQAIEDYRICERNGRIVGGVVIGHKASNYGNTSGRWTPADCEQLLAFFVDDGECHRLLTALGMQVDAARIRRALGMDRVVHPIFRSVRPGGIAPCRNNIHADRGNPDSLAGVGAPRQGASCEDRPPSGEFSTLTTEKNDE